MTYTLVIGFIIIFILVKFTVRGLFDAQWRKKIQRRINGVKQQKIFWYLMDNPYCQRKKNELGQIDIGKFQLAIRDIFRNFLRYMSYWSLTQEYPVTHYYEDQYNINKNILQKNKTALGNFNIVVSEIEKQEKIINALLNQNSFTVGEAEIRQKFEKYKHKGYLMVSDDEFNKLTSCFFRLNPNAKNGNEIWGKRKIFGEASITDIAEVRDIFLAKPTNANEYELGYGFGVEPNYAIFNYLIVVQHDIGEVIDNLLCEKIANKESAKKLEKSLKEWEQLQMLQWCLWGLARAESITRFGRAWWSIIAALV